MSDAARVIAIYDANLSEWRRLRSQALVERRWLERFREGLPGRDILDIGCADGRPMAGYLIKMGARLTGIDGAPRMIAAARAAYPEQTWRVADMRGLDLGRRFDGLLAWCSFFHLSPEDQPGMFPIFARHARPGAKLMFTSGTARGEAYGSFGGARLYHGSLDSETYGKLLEENGFQVLDHGVSDPECGGLTIWHARYAGLAG